MTQDPAAFVDLPNGRYVSLAAVFVDSLCTSGDRNSGSGCRQWEQDNVLGDANGLVGSYVAAP